MKRTGDSVDPAAAERLKARALRLLARREHTVKELGGKLVAKGEDEHLVRSIVAELAAKDLVSDARYADAFVREAVESRPRSRDRLVTELVERGVPARTAAGAVDRAFAEAGVDDGALARVAAERYLPRVEDAEVAARWRRLAGHLQRRGFDNARIYDLCRELLPSAEPDPE